MLLRSLVLPGSARRALTVLLLFTGLTGVASHAAEQSLGLGLSVPLAWVRWSDNLFQEGTLTRAAVSSSVVTGAIASLEYGAVALRLGGLGTAGESRFAPYMPPFALEPYAAPRSLRYLVAGVIIRRPSVVLRSATNSPGVHWLPRAGFSYWTNIAYDDVFHGESRETLSRAERVELDELFFEFGTEAEFRIAEGWAGRVSILLAYNLLGENLAWMDGVAVMETTRYLPLDAAVGAEFSVIRRVW